MKATINKLSIDLINKIAAGEVIQRPSSVIKELVENSIDAESTDIKLLIKDYGKTLIEISDNGLGMNDKDLRLCFLKHTTSKISKSSDSILASASTLANGVKEGNKNKNVSKRANRDGLKSKRGNTIGLRLPMTSPRLYLIYAIALHGH